MSDRIVQVQESRLVALHAENERLRGALAGMIADHEAEFPSHVCGFLAAAKEALIGSTAGGDDDR